ncbi:Excinuclease Cho [Izhakiella capsodis]|uniref:Excinuclease cho n=1 Tax=Izhakiella capsodis TaxID=1367852 RepID=A0A1I4UZ62_9GAMM|nr:excinuclease Cho [Izhakiella capsodis]SFM94165.1 Excinuclease Cho [Izhakiella capsodis]
MTRSFTANRSEYDKRAIYQYPEHLRPSLAALPTRPGVYTFHGESDSMPLYIGKSINIRHRVLSHLRAPNEASMLRQARRISFITTAGELGALLLEAQMIKLQQPLFNKRLRHNRQLCSLQLMNSIPTVVYAKNVNFATTSNLYGLFSSRTTALKMLHKLADTHRLCNSLLGLERGMRGRACFRYALGRCSGACCGKETTESHFLRLCQALEALKVQCWPWHGAVGLVEVGPYGRQIHVICNWYYLGSVSDICQADALTRPLSGFDHDGYKILCKPLLDGAYEIIAL